MVQVPKLPPGYYELVVQAKLKAVDKAPAHWVSFAMLRPDTRKDDADSKFAVWLHSWYTKDSPGYEPGRRWAMVRRLMRKAGFRWGIDVPWGREKVKQFRESGLHLQAYWDPPHWPSKNEDDAKANARSFAAKIKRWGR